MSVMVAVGRGATAGVLIRDAEALERLSSVDTVVVDKTGTLTKGRPVVGAIECVDERGEDALLRSAAAVEAASEHPLARAIEEEAARRSLAVPEAVSVTASPGRGISGRVEGDQVLVGTETYLRESGVDVPKDDEGRTTVCVAEDGVFVGRLRFEDPLRKGAPEAIASLRSMGIRVVMATGDAEGAARRAAEETGVDEVHARMLPEGKKELVESLSASGRRVACLGDGINDAPALAAASVGIAMGTGTDAAMEAAAVTLVRGDIRGVVRALRLGRAAMTNIRENLFFAFVYNTLGVPVAAGALYPVFGILLGPMAAGAAMSLSSVSVVANALRLRRVRL